MICIDYSILKIYRYGHLYIYIFIPITNTPLTPAPVCGSTTQDISNKIKNR